MITPNPAMTRKSPYGEHGLLFPLKKILFLVITMNNKNFELWKRLTGKTVVQIPVTKAPTKTAYFNAKVTRYWK